MTDAVESMISSPLFPFEGEMRLKSFGPLLGAELTRSGEGDNPCHRCADLTRDVIWSNDRWLVSAAEPNACPVTVFLETVAHVDLHDLDDDLASELGRLIVRVEAAVRAVPDVGRVHVHRWSEGSAHLHLWFFARPARRLEMYGWGNELWSQVLPPIARDEFDRNLAIVADALTRGDRDH